MQEAITLPTLELRGYKSNKVSALIIWVGILCYLVWNRPDGSNTIMFLIVFSVLILTIINIFDKRPLVIIDQAGIWKRKYILPFSPMTLVNWNEMEYLHLLRKEDEESSKSFYLVIRKRETEKDVKVELTTLDSSLETVFSLVRQYAEKYGIHDLGEEIR